MVRLLLILAAMLAAPVQAQDADPTRPVVQNAAVEAEQRRPPNLTLRSIHYQHNNTSARINDETYRVGDTIENYTVVDIEPDRVRLEYNGDELWLSVFAPQRIRNGERQP
ncbi:hypothetical protein ACR0ST_00075 [Aliidiomarina sp. Khilg15.8]